VLAFLAGLLGNFFRGESLQRHEKQQQQRDKQGEAGFHGLSSRMIGFIEK
jgi:hypothetical protein